jgi:hypothetical protein
VQDPRDKFVLKATKIFRFFYLSIYFYWMPFLVFIFNWVLTVLITANYTSSFVIKTQEGMQGWDTADGGFLLTYLDANKDMMCQTEQPAIWKWTWSGHK